MGIVEEVANLSDAKNSDILQYYAAGEVAVRSSPRKTYSITPFPYFTNGRVPEPFVDYDIGDIVTLSAKWGKRINIEGEPLRVFGMSFNIDEEGNERPGPLELASLAEPDPWSAPALPSDFSSLADT